MLTDRDRAMLDFESQWWHYAGAKETAIREVFGMSENRYHQVLRRLVTDPDALAYAPATVKRLTRLRAERAAARQANAAWTTSTAR